MEALSSVAPSPPPAAVDFFRDEEPPGRRRAEDEEVVEGEEDFCLKAGFRCERRGFLGGPLAAAPPVPGPTGPPTEGFLLLVRDGLGPALEPRTDCWVPASGLGVLGPKDDWRRLLP